MESAAVAILCWPTFLLLYPHKAVQKVRMMLWISKVIRSSPIS